MTYNSDSVKRLRQRLSGWRWNRWTDHRLSVVGESRPTRPPAADRRGSCWQLAPGGCEHEPQQHGIQVVRRNRCVAIRFEPELGPTDPPSRWAAARKAMTLLSSHPGTGYRDTNLS
jgi:hypothetical protein